MVDLKIRLLGGLDISGPGVAHLTRKARAVCAYLALRQGEPQPRGRIATLFWENSPEEQARTSLRQCLSILRKSINGAVSTDADAVCLDFAGAEVDARQLERLIGGGGRAGLEEAVEIYRGDLLDGCAVNEEAFEAWLRPERERYRCLMADGLGTLIDLCEADQDISSAVRYCCRLLELDPLNEVAHRRLMRFYSAQGRHSDALKQFKTCQDQLERELGVAPQPETVALRARLLTERRVGSEASAVPSSVQSHKAEVEALGIDFSLPSKPSMIVIPFEDLSDNGALHHFTGGVRIDLQSALVKISGLFVIAAGSAATYARRSVSAGQVAEEMGVRYVLEGAIQGNRTRIRVSTKLTDGLSGKILWSEHYDRDLDDTLQIQDEIIERIVTGLDVELVGGEQARVWRKTLHNPKALALYYRGLALLERFDKQNVAAARQLFERVGEISPDVTLGPTLVAFCHFWDATMGWAQDVEAAKDAAEEWSRKAATMEDADGQAHAILAHVKLLRGAHEEALGMAEAAIAIRPLCANTNGLYANILLYCGRPRDAIERITAAIRYAPVYAAWWLEVLASAYRDVGQPEQAIAVINELLKKNPENVNAILIITTALVASGRLEDARQQAVRVLQLEPDFAISTYLRRHSYMDKADVARLAEWLRAAGLP